MDSDNQKSKPTIIGRQYELDTIRAAFIEVAEKKKPRVVFIRGDFGTGKTYLVDNFLHEISNHNSQPIIAKGLCSLETELSGLFPFSQITKSLESQSLKLRIISSNWLNFVKEVAPAWLDIITFGIADATVKTIEEGGKAFGTNIFSQQNVFEQFLNILRKLSNKHPIILFIDDLHWADESSLRLLFHLIRNIGDCPILLLGAYRPVTGLETSQNADLFREIRANILRYKHIEITLEEGISVEDYLKSRYPNIKFSTELTTKIQKSTGGHPLFVSELCNLWEDQKLLTDQNSNEGMKIWSMSQDETQLSIEIPQSVSIVLDLRLRNLTDLLLEILDNASVDGEEFSVQAIVYVSEKDEDVIFENIKKLENNYRLIQETESINIGNDVYLDYYRFKHPFFQEYIYEKISKGQKRKIHLKLANFFEEIYPARSEKAGLIANHYYQGQKYNQAVNYIILAAKHEQSRYAWAEAEAWCNLGLDIIRKLPDTAETQRLKFGFLKTSGDGFFDEGEFSKAHSRYERLLTLAQKLKFDPLIITRIYQKFGDILDGEGEDFLTTKACYEKARETLARVPEGIEKSILELSIESDYTYMVERQGESEKSITIYWDLLNKASQLYKTTNNSNYQSDLAYITAYTYNYLGIALGNIGLHKKSIPAFQNAITLSQKTKFKAHVTTWLLNQSDDLIKIGQFDQAMEVTHRALELALQIGDIDSEAFAYANIGEALILQGQFHQAIEKLKLAIELSKQIGASWNMAYLYAGLAYAYSGLNHNDVAVDFAAKGYEFSKETDYKYEVIHSIICLATVLFRDGDWKSSNEHFIKAFKLLKDTQYRYLHAVALKNYGQAKIMRGETNDGKKCLNQAAAIFTSLENDYQQELVEDLIK